MISIIIYLTDAKYIDLTINDIIDKTPYGSFEIIICDDHAGDYECENDAVRVLSTDGVGRSIALNSAAKICGGNKLIFINQNTKVSANWSEPLIDTLDSDDKVIASPVICDLDINLWASGDMIFRRFGWRWDFSLYNRQSGDKYSPGVSQFCLAINKDWFTDLGGFDCGMISGDGCYLEMSIRCWLCGGSVVVLDESVIATSIVVDESVTNLARIVEVWFPAFANYFYKSRGLNISDVDVGRLEELLSFQQKQQITANMFLSSRMPELLGIFDLYNSAAGKSIAIVADGSSIDEINRAFIYRHDFVIGADYISKVFDCDYVVTHDIDVVTQLRDKYTDEQFVLPFMMKNRMAGVYSKADEVCSGSVQFELGTENSVQGSIFPPFTNFDNSIHSAVHFALFLGSSDITLFGCDNKIVGDKYYSTNIEYYKNNMVDSEATRRKLAAYEYGLDSLGKLANKNNSKILRMNYL